MNELKTYYRYEHKNDYSDIFVLREIKSRGRQNNCFDTKEDAKKHFDESRQIANERYNKIMKEIEILKETIGDFSIEGWATADDDSGLDYGGCIEIIVNGYEFSFR